MMETYSSDLAKIAEGDEAGIIKKIVEEEEVDIVSPTRRRNARLLVGGAILTILAVAAVFVVFLFRQQIFNVEVKPKYVPIIFTDQTDFEEISGLNKTEIAQTVVKTIQMAEVKAGGVEGIYLTENKQIVGWRKFLDLIEANLDRTKIDFLGDSFLLGAVKEDTTSADSAGQSSKNFFVLLQMRSRTDIFEPMQAWENKIFSDLHGFFGLELNANTKYLLEKDFEDGFVQNKNARILYDENGKIVLMYVYAGDDSLVITGNENVVRELILRLASARVKK